MMRDLLFFCILFFTADAFSSSVVSFPRTKSCKSLFGGLAYKSSKYVTSAKVIDFTAYKNHQNPPFMTHYDFVEDRQGWDNRTVYIFVPYKNKPGRPNFSAIENGDWILHGSVRLHTSTDKVFMLRHKLRSAAHRLEANQLNKETVFEYTTFDFSKELSALHIVLNSVSETEMQRSGAPFESLNLAATTLKADLREQFVTMFESWTPRLEHTHGKALKDFALAELRLDKYELFEDFDQTRFLEVLLKELNEIYRGNTEAIDRLQLLERRMEDILGY